MSAMENPASSPNSNPNPWTQPVSLLAPDGSTIGLSMEDFNSLRIYGARIAISYGTQIGASFLLLLVLLLLTRAEKRKSSIFIINALCLVTNAIRCVLLSCFVTSTWFNPYSQILGVFNNVSSLDEATLVAMNTFSLIVTILVMISLSLQVYVVCITTASAQRWIIMGATTLMALVATGYKFAFVILSTRTNLQRGSFNAYNHVAFTSYVTQAVSIWVFSCVFTYKLGHAIVQRRKLKMPQFGPMQIVFIMGCQTLIIPAIFSTLQFQDAVPELGSQVLTVVCIFLPLSAIWAGVVNETAIATKGADGHHRLIQNEFYRAAPGGSTVGSGNGSTASTAMEKSGEMSVCTCATHSAPTSPRKSAHDEEEDDMDVGREFGISQRSLARESA